MSKDQRLAEQVQYAYAHAPAVKQLFDDAGLAPTDIQSVADLKHVPVTTKDELIRLQRENPPFGGWLAVPISEIDTIFLSPGPLYDTHDNFSLNNSAKLLTHLGYGPGDIIMNCFSYHMVPAGLLFHEGYTRAGATVIPMGPGKIDTQIDVMLSLGINGYIGTPSFLAMILDAAVEQGITDQLSLDKALFTGEYYSPALRVKFEDEFGLTTSQCYATGDLGVIAYENYGEEGLVLMDELIVELVDPKTGEVVPDGTPGEVVVTTFSEAYPLLRFGTGDMAVSIPGTDRLRGLVGRTGDAVKVRGMFVHPNQVNVAIAQFPAITKWGAQVTREDERDYLNLQIETTDDVNLDDVKGLIKNFIHLSVNILKIVDRVENPGQIEDTRNWD